VPEKIIISDSVMDMTRCLLLFITPHANAQAAFICLFCDICEKVL